MKLYRQEIQTILVIDQILCSRCGQDTKVTDVPHLEEDQFSFGEFHFVGTYYGNLDGENFNYILCEDCTLKLKDWVENGIKS